MGAAKCNDTIPSADWDLCEIWYATSEDGFNWTEQGVAVPRPPKPYVGCRSVSTPDILQWKGKYYLYYQGFTEPSGMRGDDCPVTVSYSDSPNGPWTATNKIVIEDGAAGEWVPMESLTNSKSRFRYTECVVVSILVTRKALPTKPSL